MQIFRVIDTECKTQKSAAVIMYLDIVIESIFLFLVYGLQYVDFVLILGIFISKL